MAALTTFNISTADPKYDVMKPIYDGLVSANIGSVQCTVASYTTVSYTADGDEFTEVKDTVYKYDIYSVVLAPMAPVLPKVPVEPLLPSIPTVVVNPMIPLIS